MQTRTLETLLEIERVGSFATAATGLNMTLSAVSMQIKRLEEELGVSLFDRTFRPPKLTPLGRRVCAHAGKVVQAEGDLMNACRTQEPLSGAFRLGFVATASMRLLPDFLVVSRKHAPHANFDIETGLSEALEERILSGHIDAAVVTASPKPQTGIAYRLLRREKLVYAVPNGFAEKSLSQLFAGLPFLHFLPQSGIGKLIADHVGDHARQGRARIYLDSVEAIMECVARGIGFTLLPQPDVALHAGSRVVAASGPDIFRDLVLAYPEKGEAMSRMDALFNLFSAS